MRAKAMLLGGLACLTAPVAAAQEATRADYDCGGRKIVVWTAQDYEEQHVVVWFRDRDGKELRPNVIAPGAFIPLCTQGAFLLFDNTGAHFISGLSWIMSAEGEVLGGHDLGAFTVKHAVTDNEALVWVQSFEWDGRVARTRLVAVSAEGALVHDQRYEAATRVNLRHAGVSYPVDVLTPQMPD